MTAQQTRSFRFPSLQCAMLSTGFLVAIAFAAAFAAAQAPAARQSTKTHADGAKSRAHHAAKKQEQPAPPPVAQTPPPPPMPHWPVNDNPNPASVVWDSTGLRINATNSSLQQILKEVSTETGAKIEGAVPDQRVYGDYGPGQARDVLSQLLQGSGYNILLAGDLGQGAPREIVLSPRQARGPDANNAMNRPQQDPDDEIPEQPEEQPQIQAPQLQNNGRPGFGPNGPVRTPQQIMEEMQQRQLLQQQIQQQQIQQQQQQQQQPQQNPQ